MVHVVSVTPILVYILWLCFTVVHIKINCKVIIETYVYILFFQVTLCLSFVYVHIVIPLIF